MAPLDQADKSSKLLSKLFDIPVEITPLYGNAAPVKGLLRGASMGLLQISCPMLLPVGQDVRVQTETRGIEMRVISARELRSGVFHAELKLASESGRRAEPRLRTHIAARLLTGDDQAIRATVVDLSHFGMGLHLATAIPVGTEVVIDLGYAMAEAEVRHCSFHVDHYRLGLRVRRFFSSTGALSALFAASKAGDVDRSAVQAAMQAMEQTQWRCEAILYSLAFHRKSA
jgi:hypothetical protein